MAGRGRRSAVPAGTPPGEQIKSNASQESILEFRFRLPGLLAVGFLWWDAESHLVASYRVVLGDIVEVKCDALLTGLNPHGLWSDLHYRVGDQVSHWVNPQAQGVDGSIQRVAGWQFHAQALPLIGQKSGTTLVASSQSAHSGSFQRVLFVVDDGAEPLKEIATAALAAADKLGISSLALPLMRAGVMGSSPQDSMESLIAAVTAFQAKHLVEVLCVTRHPQLAASWQLAFERAPCKIWKGTATSQATLPKLEVLEANLNEVEADAVLLTIDPGARGQGGVHLAIREVAGEQFHRQAVILTGQPQGTTLVASAREPHQAPFDSVVFVVDRQQGTAGELLAAGLRAADAAGLTSLAVPALRMGVNKADSQEKMRDMVRSASQVLSTAIQLRRVAFVFYADPAAAQSMQHLCWTHAEGCLVGGSQVSIFEEVAVFSRDGSRVLFSPSRGMVEVREVESGQLCGRILITPWGEGSRLDVAALDPESKLALLGARFGTPSLYDVASGRALFPLPPEYPPNMPVGNKAAAFSEDGRLIAVGFDGRRVGIWEVATGARVHYLTIPVPPPREREPYQQLITHLEFNADGTTLFACCNDQVHCLWSLPGGDVVQCAQLQHEPTPWPHEAQPTGAGKVNLNLAGAPLSRQIFDAGGNWLVTVRARGPWKETVAWRILGERLQPAWKLHWEPGFQAGFLPDGSFASLTHRNQLAEARVIDTQGRDKQRFHLPSRTPRLYLSAQIALASGQLGQPLAFSLASGKLLDGGLAWGDLVDLPGGPYVMLELMHGCRRCYRLQVLSSDKHRLLVECDHGTVCLSFDQHWRVDGWLPLGTAPVAASFCGNGDLLVLTDRVFVWRKPVASV